MWRMSVLPKASKPQLDTNKSKRYDTTQKFMSKEYNTTRLRKLRARAKITVTLKLLQINSFSCGIATKK